jgi:hypothetical protein
MVDSGSCTKLNQFRPQTFHLNHTMLQIQQLSILHKVSRVDIHPLQVLLLFVDALRKDMNVLWPI